MGVFVPIRDPVGEEERRKRLAALRKARAKPPEPAPFPFGAPTGPFARQLFGQRASTPQPEPGQQGVQRLVSPAARAVSGFLKRAAAAQFDPFRFGVGVAESVGVGIPGALKTVPTLGEYSTLGARREAFEAGARGAMMQLPPVTGARAFGRQVLGIGGPSVPPEEQKAQDIANIVSLVPLPRVVGAGAKAAMPAARAVGRRMAGTELLRMLPTEEAFAMTGKPQGEDFFINVKGRFQKAVDAEPVKVRGYADFDLFTHVSPEAKPRVGHEFVLSEGKSGALLTEGSNRADAISKLPAVIKRQGGAERLKESIEQAINRTGVTPRWQGVIAATSPFKAGDTVWRTVPSIMGTPYKIEGVVYKSKDGLRVRITSADVGGARTQDLTAAWRKVAEKGVAQPEPVSAKQVSPSSRPPEPVQVGQVQASMGIGEKPPQGQLLGEFRDLGQRQALIPEEQLQARVEARRLRAAGQQELPPKGPPSGVPPQPGVVEGAFAKPTGGVKAKPPPAEPPRPPPKIALGSEPPNEDPVPKLVRLIKSAKPARKETEALKSAELKQRVAIFAKTLEAERGQEAFLKARGALKGDLPKAEFEPPSVGLTEGDTFALYERVRTTGAFGPQVLKKLNTEVALTKLLGGEIPQRAELSLLEQVFGPELVEAILSKRGLGIRAWEAFLDAINAPRTIMAAFDFSAALRQGAILGLRNPGEYERAFKDMVKVAFSKKRFKELQQVIRSDPDFGTMERAGLYIADTGPSATLALREEQYMSRLFHKIPGLREVVGASERAYVGMLNSLRYRVMKNYVAMYRDMASPDDFKALASMINIFSGRGNLGMLSNAAPVLSGVFFSSRFMVSRVQVPLTLFSGSGLARRVAVENLAAWGGGVLTILGMAKLAGADVTIDPRSSDFGKLRIGRMRIDLWSGMQPLIRNVAQFVTGQRKTFTGRIEPVAREDVAIRFTRSKLAPGPGTLVDIQTGETFIGEEVELSRAGIGRILYNQFTPMTVDDTIEAGRQIGPEGAIVAAPLAFLGVGVQTYANLAQIEDEAARRVFGKSYQELNRLQQEQLALDPEVQRELFELAQNPRDIDLRQAATYAFQQYDFEKDRLEQDLKQKIVAGRERKALKEAIQEFKQQRFNLGQVLLSDDLKVYAFGQQKQQVEDVLRDAYWMADAPEDPRTGELDFKTRDGVRAMVLAQAKQLGVDQNYILQRGSRFTDPLVRAAIEQYEADQEILKPYWDILDEVMAAATEQQRSEWRAYQEAGQPSHLRTPAIRLIDRISSQRREALRRSNPQLDAALYRWGYTSKASTPQAAEAAGIPFVPSGGPSSQSARAFKPLRLPTSLPGRQSVAGRAVQRTLSRVHTRQPGRRSLFSGVILGTGGR